MGNCPDCSANNVDGQKYCSNCGKELSILPIPQTQALPKEWYYMSKNKRMGPVSTEVVQQLLHSNKIALTTKVWTRGLTDWIDLQRTDLVNTNTPPLPCGENIDNTLVWIIAIIPFVTAVSIFLLLGNFGYIGFVFIVSGLTTILLCNADEKRLRKIGYKTKVLVAWALHFFPGYLFKRARLVKQKNTYALVFCISYVILSAVFTWTAFQYGSSDESRILSVKNATIEAYPDKTMGDMVDGYFVNPQWESINAGGGKTFISIKGKIMYSEKEVNAVLQFVYNPDDTFQYNSLEFDGVPQNKSDFEALLDAMYKE
jgi:hypothetical protein